MDAPRDDKLWFHIARSAYSGAAAVGVLFVLAFLRDLFRKTRIFSRGDSLRLRRSRFSPLRWYSTFLSRYRDTNFFYYVEVLRMAANLTVCVLYVIGTYRQSVAEYMTVVNRTLAGLFLLDVLSQILAAESAITSVLFWHVIFDVFSFPSMILASGKNAYLNFSFLRSIPAYGAYSRLERRIFVKIFSSKRLIAKLAFQTLALFYTLAAGIQLLEIPGDLLSPAFVDRWEEFGRWNFFNSAYFVIVTLSTVGYGDFSPMTLQGRLYTLFMIIVGIVIFTAVVGELVEQSRRGRGSGWCVKTADTRHVIVTGTPTLTDLVLFVSEFYSDSRQSNSEAKVVVLVEKPTWADTEWFQYIARNQFLQTRLQFLVGSVRNNIDLQRARINTADAVFFLTSPSTGEDPSQQDSRTLMNILAVRNVRTDIPIYAQTLLEDSNLQTHVALTTASSYPKGTFFRDTDMPKTAAYPGLFYEVLRTEFQDLPKAHRKEGRHCLEEIFQHHAQKHKEQSLHAAEGGKIPDLERSRFVCLQETHMALIAGNIRVNGVGTLLSNMYLDVQIAKLEGHDPAWLSEYHMGAACSLAYAIIPDALHEITVREIALELFHVGLLLVGTSDAKKVQLKPVLETNAFLRRGDIAMFLTYHHRRYVAAALNLVAARLQNGQLRHPFLSSDSSGDNVAGTVSLDVIPQANLRDGKSNDGHAGNGVHAAGRGQATSAGENVSGQRPSSSAPLFPASFSEDTLRSVRKAESHDMLGGDLLDSYEDILGLKQCSDGYMPDELSGHVIVAMEGDAPLGNLPLFLKNLWRKDKRKSMRRARRATVVVVHPSISDQYRSMFSRYEKKTLFFVEGSPSSRETWRRAKLRTAKSVATMADYTQPWHISDARTIFTLLTLDVSTADDHDIFICSELADEKSLEFLREPSHPRRRGASLGEPSMRAASPPVSPVAATMASPVDPFGDDVLNHLPGASPSVGREARTVTYKEAEDRIPHSRNGGSGLVSLQGQVGTSEGAQAKPEVGAASASINAPGNPITAPLLSAQRSMKRAVESTKSARSGEMKPMTQRDMIESSKVGADGVDPADKPGAARARRGSLFSRSRYASGELLIHSSAITLLVREYVEPGFARFYANLLGTDLSCLGLKIRLVRIPKSIFEGDRAVSRRNGHQLVPYIHIFKTLIRHGVTPLGIYRSGNAPALIPSKGRRKRGPAIVEELEPYLEKYAASQKKGMTGSGGVLGSLLSLVGDVAPSKVREAHGRHEIHGGSNGNGDNSYSSDDDDDSDGSDTEDENGQRLTGQIRSGAAGERNEALGSPGGNDGSKTAVDQLEGGQQINSSVRQTVRAVESSSFSPRRTEFLARFLFSDDESFEVPGQAKYRERPVTQNLLPYVYTLPEPNTLCADTDGIYIMCHPSFDLSMKWQES